MNNQSGTSENLTELLSNEYAQARETQRHDVIGELNKVVARAPEVTEFTNTRKQLLMGSSTAIVCLVLALTPVVGQDLKTKLFMVFLAIIGGVMAYQHRNAGKTPFMRLTRTQLWVDTLLAPVPLTDITGFSIKQPGQFVQDLYLRPDAPRPTHRVLVQIFGNQATVVEHKGPRIHITSAGLKANGKKLYADDMAKILEIYLDAANAQKQLDELQGRA